MKIIEDAPAPNPRRVRIFLAEKGLDIEFEQISMMDGEHLSKDFGALNPMHRVPVLVLDDGTAISETIAICRYFEAKHPEPNLFGQTPLQLAAIEMWNRRMELGLYHHIAQHFRHLNPKMASMEVPQIKEWGDVNKDKAIDAMGILDGQLKKHPFVAGNAFSVADITTAVAVNFMRPARIEIPEELTNLQRWFGEIKSRPSWDA